MADILQTVHMHFLDKVILYLIQIPMTFLLKGLVHRSPLFQVIAWHWTGGKLLLETLTTQPIEAYMPPINGPTGIWRNNVIMTSKRRRDVVLTSHWRYFCVVRPLGSWSHSRLTFVTRVALTFDTCQPRRHCWQLNQPYRRNVQPMPRSGSSSRAEAICRRIRVRMIKCIASIVRKNSKQHWCIRMPIPMTCLYIITHPTRATIWSVICLQV